MTTTNRHFYRCIGCLDVVTLGEKLPIDARSFALTAATCGTCSERFEYMGRAERDRLVTDAIACVCDERCTNARGPKCNCKCAGENHGIGIAGYIVVSQDRGAVPVVHSKNPFTATKALEGFRTYQRLRALVLAELEPLQRAKAAGDYLGATTYSRLRRLQGVLLRAAKARTHAARRNLLTSVLPASVLDPAPVPPARHALDITQPRPCIDRRDEVSHAHETPHRSAHARPRHPLRRALVRRLRVGSVGHAMKTPHTPGPWQGRHNGDDPIEGMLIESPGFTVALVNCPEETLHEGEEYRTYTHPDVLFANTRLIAAAPDLRAALERLADRVEQIELADGSTPDTLEARAVLAQIDGDAD